MRILVRHPAPVVCRCTSENYLGMMRPAIGAPKRAKRLYFHQRLFTRSPTACRRSEKRSGENFPTECARFSRLRYGPEKSALCSPIGRPANHRARLDLINHSADGMRRGADPTKTNLRAALRHGRTFHIRLDGAEHGIYDSDAVTVGKDQKKTHRDHARFCAVEGAKVRVRA